MGPNGVDIPTRDAAGRITEIDHHRRYTYDPAGQLTAAGERTYTYDPCGRLTRETSGTRERRYTYDPAGQLTAAGPDRFTYDPTGRRITESGGRRYHFDALDRLTAIDTPNHTTTLHVDALGELTAIDTTPLTWDTADPYSPLTSLDGHPVIGEGAPWAVDTWLAPDWQNSIGASPDADPWGGAGTEPQLGFRGELAVEGLVWLRHRAYDPATRAFLTPDPLPAVPATPYAANPYHYAGNDPINHHDPLGLRPATDADLAAQKDDGGLFGSIGGFFHDNWQYFAAAGMAAVGIGLMFTGVGGAAGIAALAASSGLLAAATDTALQKATTGQVDWNQVSTQGLIGTATGGAVGVVGAGVARLAQPALDVTITSGGLSSRSTAQSLLTTGRAEAPGAGLGDVVEQGSQGTNKIYSTRVLNRMAAEPGPYHNFPQSFDRQIFEDGNRTVVSDYFKKPKPGLSNDTIRYSLDDGYINGRPGTYEIATRPSDSGNSEVIMHRFFQPNRS